MHPIPFPVVIMILLLMAFVVGVVLTLIMWAAIWFKIYVWERVFSHKNTPDEHRPQG